MVIKEEAKKRLFERVFVCMKCNSKIKADGFKVRAGRIKCRKCGYSHLRPKSKDVKR